VIEKGGGERKAKPKPGKKRGRDNTYMNTYVEKER